MSFSLPRSLSPWKHRALEMARKLVPPHHSPYGPSWPVKPEAAARLTIRWPERYLGDNTEKWMGHLREGLGRLALLTPASIPQPFENVVLIELEWRGKRHPVAI